MLKHLSFVTGVICTGLLLAIVFWLVSVVVAPHVFFFVAHFVGGLRGPLALVLLASIGPMLVAVPFGYGFGLLPWRRPLIKGLLVALLAGALYISHFLWAGIDLFDSSGWVEFLQASLLILLFVIAAAVGTRAATRWGTRNRLIIGGASLASVSVATVIATYVTYQYVMAFARAA